MAENQKVFLDYDQEGLDRQLNLRQRWPEHAEYFARWKTDSAAAREKLGGHLDLAYGDSPGERLDLFVPAGPAAPLLAFIHGGYWQGLDKGDFSYLAPAFVDAGIAFASLNYDLAPDATIERMVAQIRAALAWLHDRGAEFGVDPGRIHVAGHSAGGHLSAMALMTDWARQPAGAPRPPDLVKGGCSVSGIYDLEPIRLSYHREVIDLPQDMSLRLSPLNHAALRGPAPLILAVGSEETEEFHRQQIAYAQACTAAGRDTRIVALSGRNHFTAADALGEPGHPLFTAVSSLVSGPA